LVYKGTKVLQVNPGKMEKLVFLDQLDLEGILVKMVAQGHKVQLGQVD
jgi:hypothetical protein